MAEEPKAEAAKLDPRTARAPKLRYQDRPEINEMFADSIRTCVFDGQLMRVEFTVARFDDPRCARHPGRTPGAGVPAGAQPHGAGGFAQPYWPTRPYAEECRRDHGRARRIRDPNGKPLTAELLRELNQARIAATAPAIACALVRPAASIVPPRRQTRRLRARP